MKRASDTGPVQAVASGSGSDGAQRIGVRRGFRPPDTPGRRRGIGPQVLFVLALVLWAALVWWVNR